MILDIGCGNSTRTIRSEDVVHADLDRNAYDVEVVCDIHNLPFRQHCFTSVHASHILEHVHTPILAVKELARVCSGVCMLKVPNARGLKVGESLDHLYSWNALTLTNLLRCCFSSVDVKSYLLYRSPSKWTTVKLLVLSAISSPCEIHAVCKNERPQKCFT